MNSSAIYRRSKSLLVLAVLWTPGVAFSQNNTPALDPGVPIAKQFQAALAPQISRPPVLDGLAASTPATIDELGSFETSISVPIPKFRNLEPEIKLQYASAAPMSTIGAGWLLSIPSVIQRTSARGGTPVYDASDIFLLDGNELVPCNATRGRGGPTKSSVVRVNDATACSTPLAGQPTYEYYFTRRESYQRIAFDTAVGDWHVWKTNGQRFDYGVAWLTALSNLPNRWLLTQVTDPLGNFVKYAYQSCNVPPIADSFNPNLAAAAATSLGDAGPDLTRRPANSFNQPSTPGPLKVPVPRGYESIIKNQSSPPKGVFAIPALNLLRREEVNIRRDANPVSAFDREVITFLADRLKRTRPERNAAPPPRRNTSDTKPVAGTELGRTSASPPAADDVLWRDAPWREATRHVFTKDEEGIQDKPWLSRVGRPAEKGWPDLSVEYVYPSSISYGKTVVSFYLEGRPDPMTFGIGDGTLAKMSCRIHSIDVQTADDTGSLARVRFDVLEYSQHLDTLHSILSKVRQFGSDAIVDSTGRLTNEGTASQMPPVSLETAAPVILGTYSGETQYVQPLPPATPSSSPLQLGTSFVETQDAKLAYVPGAPQVDFVPTTLDLNGDGLTDQVFVYYRDPSDYDYRVMLQAFLARPGGGFSRLDAFDTGVGRSVMPGDTGVFLSAQVGDVDGDGRQDLIWMFDFHDPADPQKYAHLHVAVTRLDPATGLTTTLGGSLDWAVTGLVAVPETGTKFSLWHDPVQFVTSDINGDGLDDVVLISNVSGLPDAAACAVNSVSCLDPLLTSRQWMLIPALSRGDGTFQRVPEIRTSWRIRGSLYGIYDSTSKSITQETFFAQTFSLEAAEALFRPGTEDRFFAIDINADGKADVVRLANEGPWQAEHLEICRALPRTARTDDPVSDLFELNCSASQLPPLSNTEIYVPGDLDGDERVDLARVFEWYSGGPKGPSLRRPLCPGCGDISYSRIDNGTVGFEALISDGRSFVIEPETRTQLAWPRNYRSGIGFLTQYWNVYNYFGQGWICANSKDDSRCHLSLLRHPFKTEYLTDDDTYFGRFSSGTVFQDEPLQTLSMEVAFLSEKNAVDGFVFSHVSTAIAVHRDATPDGFHSTTIVDQNADGRSDVVNWIWKGSSVTAGVRSESWKVETYFSRKGPTEAEESSPGTDHLVFADLDGDGLLDAASVETWAQDMAVSVAFRKPGGGLQRKPAWQSSNWPTIDGRGRETFVGDFDVDGRHDLLNVRYAPESDAVEVHALLSKGDGTFKEVVSYPSVSPPSILETRTGFLVADVDGDGRTDIIHLTNVVGLLRIDVLLSNGDGQFTVQTDVVNVSDVPGHGAAFLPIDANGDGRVDLVGFWSLPGGGAVGFTLLSQGKGWRSVKSLFPDLGLVIQPLNWHGVDLNADRLSDVEQVGLAERGGKYDVWLLQMRSVGDGTWQARRTRAVTLFPYADTKGWVVADTNGDGKSDLVHARSEAGNLSLTTLITTPGTYPLRSTWAAPGINQYQPSAVRLHAINLGEGIDSLEAVGGYASNRASHFLDGWRFDLLKPASVSDRIINVTDGLGGQTTVKYTTTAGVPTPDPGNVVCQLPPAITFQPASSVRRSDGNGNSTTVSYSRKCPHWSFRERRVLGYQDEVFRESGAANKPERVTSQRYLLTDSCARQLESSRKSGLGSGSASNSSSLSYEAPGLLRPFHCKVTQIEESETDGLGSIASKGSSFTYDRFGNPAITIEIGDPTIAGDERRTEQAFSLLGDTFHVVRDTLEIFADSAGARLVFSQQSCYDGHQTQPGVPCGHNASDPGLATAIDVWDDHNDLWYRTAVTYDAVGNTISSTDALGQVTQTTWDPVHNLFPIAVINAKGQTKKTSWDPVHGKILSKTDSNNVVQYAASYDALGRVATSKAADGTTAVYTYLQWGDPTQQQIRTTFTAGTESTWSASRFDGFGRTVKEQRRNGEGNSTYEREWRYSDASPDPSGISDWHDPGSPATLNATYFYDYRSRPVRVVHADNSTVQRQYFTRRTVAIDEVGRKREVSADAYDRVTSITEFDSMALVPYVSRLEYDALGHLTGRSDSMGNRWSYHVNSLGWNWQIDSPDSGIKRFEFDPVGNITRQEDARGIALVFQYDTLGRMISKSGPTRISTWSYDDTTSPFGIGRLASIRDSIDSCALSREYKYDAVGNVLSDTICIDGETKTMQFAYDTFGRQSSVIYPDGETVNSSYDSAGRLKEVSGIVEISRDAMDRVSRETFGNGVVEERSYDDKRGWLLSQNVTLPGSPAQRFNSSYLYSPNGDLATAIQTADDLSSGPAAQVSVRRQYAYDGLGRLADVAVSGTALPGSSAPPLPEHFAYDRLGNMLKHSVLGSLVIGPDAASCAQHGACGGGPHSVRSVTNDNGTSWFSYDSAGNLIGLVSDRSTSSYQYDENGWLTSATVTAAGDTRTVEMAYDVRGDRTKKKVDGKTYVYFGRYLERDPDGRVSKLYFADGQLVARRMDASLTFFVHDQLGSTRIATDQTGKPLSTFDYSSFGNRLAGDSAVVAGHTYAGHLDDVELTGTGGASLVYMKARYYDPGLGRFLSADSIVTDLTNPQSWNPYSYVLNKPTMLSDPSGHEEERAEHLEGRLQYRPGPGFVSAYRLWEKELHWADWTSTTLEAGVLDVFMGWGKGHEEKAYKFGFGFAAQLAAIGQRFQGCSSSLGTCATIEFKIGVGIELGSEGTSFLPHSIRYAFSDAPPPPPPPPVDVRPLRAVSFLRYLGEYAQAARAYEMASIENRDRQMSSHLNDSPEDQIQALDFYERSMQHGLQRIRDRYQPILNSLYQQVFGTPFFLPNWVEDR